MLYYTFSKVAIATVIILIITSNKRLADMPGKILLSKEESGLPITFYNIDGNLNKIMLY